MGYVSTGMGDRLGVLLVSLIALRLVLVDRNKFRSCFLRKKKNTFCSYDSQCEKRNRKYLYSEQPNSKKKVESVLKIVPWYFPYLSLMFFYKFYHVSLIYYRIYY